MIKFCNIRKAYGTTEIIHNLNLEIPKGELVVIIGPSGCGKTTTLKMINRLVEPTSGSIMINGTDVLKMNPIELRRNIGYVIQQIGLFPNMTVEQNIAVVPKLLGWDYKKIKERVIELLELVHMPYEQYSHKYPRELSGGQQQRVGVLRALAAKPPVILMDEPFGALDPITRDALQDEVKKLQQSLQMTVVFVTHDMHEALKLADTVVFMDKGHVLQVASPEELLRNPANTFIKEFMGKHHHNTASQSLKISDFMKADVLKVTSEKHTLECIELMHHRNVNSLVVVDQRGTYEGVVTIEDIRKSGKAGGKIKDLVNQNASTVQADDDARQVLDAFLANRSDFIIVLNSSNEVIGLITKTSVVKAMANALWGDLIA